MPATVLPNATGTVRYLPELGILEVAPVAGIPQSTYFKTTDLNREFRRGFLEFEIPEFAGEITNATLVLPEWRAWVGEPVPPDLHELSYYPADIAIASADFNQSTTFIASFETNASLEPQIFTFDMTTLIIEWQGGRLGFRVKLVVDPTYNETASFGTGFHEVYQDPPPHIAVTVVPAIPPVADAGEDLTVPPGGTVLFNGSESTDNVGVVNYTWRFTDGTNYILYGETVSHTFERSGTYEITFTVRDAAGQASTETIVITVTGGSGDSLFGGVNLAIALSILVAALVLGALVLVRSRKR